MSAKNKFNRHPTPINIDAALKLAMLRMAVVLLTGFELHVLQAGKAYSLVGEDGFALVTVNDDVAGGLSCTKPCLHAEVVQLWRHELRELGGKP